MITQSLRIAADKYYLLFSVTDMQLTHPNRDTNVPVELTRVIFDTDDDSIRRSCEIELAALMKRLQFAGIHSSADFLIRIWLPSIFDHRLNRKFAYEEQGIARRALLKQYIEIVLIELRIRNVPMECFLNNLMKPEEQRDDATLANNTIDLMNTIRDEHLHSKNMT